MPRIRAWRILLIVVGLIVLAIAAACASQHKAQPTTRAATATTAASIAELWIDPSGAERDLFAGPGGTQLAPDPAATYTFAKEKTHGTSPGYRVRDPSGRKWSVKLGAEAQPEVVVSRLLWGVGYHQPPTYYVSRFELERDGKRIEQRGARFRPELEELDKHGYWAWEDNPFLGTRPYRGLLVLNMMVNNWDLKTEQNPIFDLDREREGARRWYVVRDVGASLGRTPGRVFDGTPNDLTAFEHQGFITGVVGGHVQFDYIRPRTELFADITPDEARWACDLLARLSDRQWNDAFRAGGYGPAESARYIHRLREKIAQGRALSG